MSLRVWLPLNGDTKNYGASNTALETNSGATVNASGKIGSCYYFNNHYISYTCNAVKSFTECSVCLWVKLSTSHAAYAQVCTLGTAGTSWNNILLGIDINGSGVPIGNVSNGSTYINCNSNIAIKDGIWHHLCFTYTSVTSKIYIDGVLKATQALSITPNFNGISNIFVGGNSSGERLTDGYINDYRVYDHCLSYSEVKEISRAIVAYYPLSEGEIEPTTNLFGSKSENFSDWSSYGFGSTGVKSFPSMSPALSGQVCQVTDGSSNTSNHAVEMATWATGPQLSNGEKVTLSAYVKGSENTIGKTCFIHVYNSNGSVTQSDTLASCTLTGSWQRVSGQFTWRQSSASSNSYSNYVVCEMSTGQYFYFSNVQLEAKDHVTPYVNGTRTGLTVPDCSGYNRNGTTTANTYPSVVSDSPRYSKSCHFSTINKSLSLNSSFLPIFTTGSISWWAKVVSIGINGLLPFSGPTESYYVAASSSWTGAFYNDNVGSATKKYYIDGIEDNTPSGADSKWHHYVVTGLDMSSWPVLWLNNYVDWPTYWNASNIYYSDIKFYNTILSDDDISKEYHNFASIYNNGSLSAYDFSEV